MFYYQQLKPNVNETIVINNTVENEWFIKSHENEKFITVDEANLDKILAGEEYNTYQKPIPKLSFRF